MTKREIYVWVNQDLYDKINKLKEDCHLKSVSQTVEQCLIEFFKPSVPLHKETNDD